MILIMATHNQKKLREMQRILQPLAVTVRTADLPEVEETGATFAENAYLKAFSACRETGLPAVADDSGIVIDALNGAPGIYSARYGGEGLTDEDRVQKVLENMQGVPEEQRTARFVCSICCVFPDGTVLRAEDSCEGIIGYRPIGENGFGYDPIFMRGERSFAQFSDEEKDAVSHRGKALRKFYEELKAHQTIQETTQTEEAKTMLTSKQRAYLKGEANSLSTILIVGKGGVSDDVIQQAEDALRKRELIKGKVLETAPKVSRDTAEEVAERTGAEVVQVIGNKFILYRENSKDPIYTLPKA